MPRKPHISQHHCKITTGVIRSHESLSQILKIFHAYVIKESLFLFIASFLLIDTETVVVLNRRTPFASDLDETPHMLGRVICFYTNCYSLQVMAEYPI